MIFEHNASEIDLTDDVLLTAEQVCEKLSISRRTLDTKKKSGDFPEPVCYVFSSPRWSIRQLNEWLNRSNGDPMNHLNNLMRRR
ncbi:helix-turn-helix transcriptional regulator [Vibrio rotiferianus]|uniref:helix-turn-helix transcriptional regulator n=1 Tax=Vibrio rotiferianus TaxID=190895 RepID=UPI00390911A2